MCDYHGVAYRYKFKWFFLLVAIEPLYFSLQRGSGLGHRHNLFVTRHESFEFTWFRSFGTKVSIGLKQQLESFYWPFPKWLPFNKLKLNIRAFFPLCFFCRDLMAIVSALEYNTFFRGLKVTHTRLSHETLERILHVLRRSMWLEELHLEALGLRYGRQFISHHHILFNYSCEREFALIRYIHIS